MTEAPYLGRRELIALIRELALVAQARGRLRKHLKAVLAEADRQERERKRKALVAKRRREERRKEQLKVWREKAVLAKQQAETRKREEEKSKAWVLRHGDHSIETVFGIPVKLETFEELKG